VFAAAERIGGVGGSVVGTDRSDEDARDVRRCLAGDVDAFGELVKRHHRMIWLYCWRQVRDAGAADEAAAAIFVRAYGQLARLHEPDRFWPWLCCIAVTELPSRARRQPAAWYSRWRDRALRVWKRVRYPTTP